NRPPMPPGLATSRFRIALPRPSNRPTKYVCAIVDTHVPSSSLVPSPHSTRSTVDTQTPSRSSVPSPQRSGSEASPSGTQAPSTRSVPSPQTPSPPATSATQRSPLRLVPFPQESFGSYPRSRVNPLGRFPMRRRRSSPAAILPALRGGTMRFATMNPATGQTIRTFDALDDAALEKPLERAHASLTARPPTSFAPLAAPYRNAVDLLRAGQEPPPR